MATSIDETLNLNSNQWPDQIVHLESIFTTSFRLIQVARDLSIYLAMDYAYLYKVVFLWIYIIKKWRLDKNFEVLYFPFVLHLRQSFIG